jgi:hypothetical protein
MKRKVKKHIYDMTYMNDWPEPVDVSLCGRANVIMAANGKRADCKRCLAKRRSRKESKRA